MTFSLLNRQKKCQNTTVIWSNWGHFEALFQHETASDFQKRHSLLCCLFADECFHSSKYLYFRKIQQNSRKNFEFRLLLGIRDIVLPRKLESFMSKA